MASYSLIRARRIDTDCVRIYKAPNWTVDVGDIVEVEAGEGTSYICTAIGVKDYTDDKDNAFWFETLGIDGLKKVLKVAKMRPIDWEGEDA